MSTTTPEANAPKQPIEGVTIQAPNPQFSAAQRLSYIKTTKDNNVVLELEAKKWKHIYEALYFKTMTEQLQLEIAANEAAKLNSTKPQPQQEAPATSGPWGAEATTSGPMDELVSEMPIGHGVDIAVQESEAFADADQIARASKPIMEVHHSEALVD